MSGELVVDGPRTAGHVEDAPEQVEAIIEMMIDADEDMLADERKVS